MADRELSHVETEVVELRQQLQELRARMAVLEKSCVRTKLPSCHRCSVTPACDHRWGYDCGMVCNRCHLHAVTSTTWICASCARMEATAMNVRMAK